MARIKVFLLLAIIGIIPASAALSFNVDVDPDADAGIYDAQYMNETEGLHEFNVSIENPASAGCTYYLRGNYEQGEEVVTRYSNGYAMWPGNSTLMELKHMPLDYNGTVRADIDLVYCGIEKNVSSFEFDVSERNAASSKFESETVEVSDKDARVEFSVSEGLLVPEEAPAYWKVGSSEIMNGSAHISYDPTIFRSDKQITYSILSPEGEPLGETTVKLEEPEPTLIERLKQRSPQILAALLLVSFTSNLYLTRKRFIPEKIRLFLANVAAKVKQELSEFGDRDLRTN